MAIERYWCDLSIAIIFVEKILLGKKSSCFLSAQLSLFLPKKGRFCTTYGSVRDVCVVECVCSVWDMSVYYVLCVWDVCVVWSLV